MPSDAFDAMAARDVQGIVATTIPHFAIVVIILPFIETVITCGIWLPAAAKRFGRHRGILLVGVIFALLHVFQVPFVAVGVILISSLIMLRLYVITDSLYPSLLMHTCWNFSMSMLGIMYNWGLPAPP